MCIRDRLSVPLQLPVPMVETGSVDVNGEDARTTALGSASMIAFSPPRSVFPISFISSSTSLGGRPPPTDEAGIAETGPQADAIDVDEFGRAPHEREWTRHYRRVEERDDEGDIMPDGAFSSSAGDGDVANLDDVDDHDSDGDSLRVCRG